MKTPKRWAIFAFSAICAVSLPSFGQQRVFNWLPANDESVRLDPANYHSGRTYHPGPNGGNMHVDIKAQQPVTIFLANADAWTQALQHPENIAGLMSKADIDGALVGGASLKAESFAQIVNYKGG